MRRGNVKPYLNIVVPANAGTHTPRPLVGKILLEDFRATQRPVVMGPGVRRDDVVRHNGIIACDKRMRLRNDPKNRRIGLDASP
jgi:hypothetical protein